MKKIASQFSSYLLLLIVITGLGCSSQGFKPQNAPEVGAYALEKLDTILTGVDTAYTMGGIDRERKNKLLDEWQEIKDATDLAINTYFAGGGAFDINNATLMVREMVLRLVALGVLEEGAEE